MIRVCILLFFFVLVSNLLTAQSFTVATHQRIDENNGGFEGNLNIGDLFGRSITSIGDLDNDGVMDVAVGAPWDNEGGTQRGAVWILFLNADGTVKSHQKISDHNGNFNGTLDN